MIEVLPNLYVGSQDSYAQILADAQFEQGWMVVHACKEPMHREMLGYTERAAPKDHPEYLYGFRGNRLILNLVDVEDKRFIAHEIIVTALKFIDDGLRQSRKVLVHCNQGRSRSPVIAMLYMAPGLSASFVEAEEMFARVYPEYAPNRGMRDFAVDHWSEFFDASRPEQS